MTKIFCDLCGKEIINDNDDRAEFDYRVDHMPEERTISERHYDIHRAHVAQIVSTIENLFAKERKGVKSK